MTKYERHIKQLCKENKIQVFYVDRKYSCNVYLKKVWIPKQIRSLKRYAIAMHEIGHIINEYPHVNVNLWKDAWELWRNKKMDFTSRFTLIKEIEAWKVASSIAKWWGQEANKVASFSISTYIECYNDCHKKAVINDDKILKQIAEFFLNTGILPK